MSTTDPTDLVPGQQYRITVEGQEDGGLVGTYAGDLPAARNGGTNWDFGELGPGAFVFAPAEEVPADPDPWAVDPAPEPDPWALPTDPPHS